MLCHAQWCYIMLCHGTPCYDTLGSVRFCPALLCYAMRVCVMLRTLGFVTPCCVALCSVLPCYVMLCDMLCVALQDTTKKRNARSIRIQGHEHDRTINVLSAIPWFFTNARTREGMCERTNKHATNLLNTHTQAINRCIVSMADACCAPARFGSSAANFFILERRMQWGKTTTQ